MSHTVVLEDDTLFDAATQDGRTPNAQIEYWAQLGKFVEESGYFDLQKVHLAFQGKLPISELTGAEKEIHTRLLWDALEDLDGSEDPEFFDRLKAAGIPAYGLKKNGIIIKN